MYASIVRRAPKRSATELPLSFRTGNRQTVVVHIFLQVRQRVLAVRINCQNGYAPVRIVACELFQPGRVQPGDRTFDADKGDNDQAAVGILVEGVEGTEGIGELEVADVTAECAALLGGACGMSEEKRRQRQQHCRKLTTIEMTR